VALGLAFAATVVAEMAGAETGLGYRIMASHQNYVYDQMVAAILFIGVVGALMDRMLISIVRLLFPWLEDANAV
jgi:ABC-type nitrate/sulfonate/bicarbonate transport system permease component